MIWIQDLSVWKQVLTLQSLYELLLILQLKAQKYIFKKTEKK